jgi:hypothetical protein
MNLHRCDTESAIIAAARSGRLDVELREHAAACSNCADALLAAQCLCELSELDRAGAHVPAAGRVWWKAQLKARRAATECATTPIRFVERIASACAVLLFVGACIWQWQSFRVWFDSLSGALLSGRHWVEGHAVSVWQNPNTLMVIGVSALLIFITVVACLVWAED